MKPLVAKNYGGSRQLTLEDADDLARIGDIDPACWAATSVPLGDLHCDPALHAILDPGKSGRLRADGLVEQRDWLFARLACRDRLVERSESLRIADLGAESAEGFKLKAAAERIAAELGLAGSGELSLAQVRDYRKDLGKRLANGDGVICAAQIGDAEMSRFAEDIVKTVGGAPELSGAAGVGKADVARFLERAAAFRAWQARGEQDPAILPLGEKTAAAAALIKALRPKVEEFFFRCDMLQIEGRTPEEIRASVDELRQNIAQGNAGLTDYLEKSPLAAPNPDRVLALEGPLNPFWSEKLLTLQAQVLTRLPPAADPDPAPTSDSSPLSPAHAVIQALSRLPKATAGASLTPERWQQVEAALAPYEAWQADKPAEPFEAIAGETLARYTDPAFVERLTALIDVDLSAAGDLAQIDDLARLILLQRWLLELANNVVNFSAFYATEKGALVDAGSLVVDGRRLEFCLRIGARAAHKVVAAESLLFLVYAAISEKEGAPVAFEIVAPVTAGERGHLRVGKRGIFIDTQGKHWDAVIVDLVENPISIAEAIRAPFRRAGKFISTKFEEFTAKQAQSSEKKIEERLAKTSQAAEAGKAGAAAAPAEKKGGVAARDLLLGGGIAFAALGSTLAFIVSALSEVNPLRALIAVASVCLAIVFFTALVSWFKLRRRDLSLLLEANGWAVNARMRLTKKLGRLFTRAPGFPEGTVLQRGDLLARPEDRSPVVRGVCLGLLILAVAAAVAGWVNREALKAAWSGWMDPTPPSMEAASAAPADPPAAPAP